MEKKQIIQIAGAALGGFLLGGTAGYILSRRGFEKQLAEVALEVDSLKEAFDEGLAEVMNNHGGGTVDDAPSLEEYAGFLISLGYEGSYERLEMMYASEIDITSAIRILNLEIDPIEADGEDEEYLAETLDQDILDTDIKSVFDEFNNEDPPGVEPTEADTTYADDILSEEYRDMVLNRTPGEPYIIHVDEYNRPLEEGEPAIRDLTLFYYDGDDTLTDDTGGVVTNVNGVIGSDALVNFGNWSRDRDRVYVRNEETACDYMVIRRNESYVDAVLGGGRAANLMKMREDD